MSIKALLVLLASVLWFMFSTYWYCCHIQHKDCSYCPQKVETKSAVVPVAPVEKSPITFQWSDQQAQTTDAFTDYKAGILKSQTTDNLLEIVGYYSPEEQNTSSFENIGLARANQTRELFAKDIPEERIRLRAEPRDANADMKTAHFESVAFNWIKQETKETEIIELSDKVIILFPFNSSIKEAAPDVDEFLDQLAIRLKQSKEKVSIIGHTDNVGEEGRNQKLGRNRARQIRAILWDKGVSRSQITIGSKGETVPVATNKTEEGRHQNRRVEVKVEGRR